MHTKHAALSLIAVIIVSNITLLQCMDTNTRSVSNFLARQCIIKKYGYTNASSTSFVATDDLIDRDNKIYVYARNNIEKGPVYEKPRHPGETLTIVNDTHLVSGHDIKDGLWIDAITENTETRNVKLPGLPTTWLNGQTLIHLSALKHIPKGTSVSFISYWAATIVDIAQEQITHTIKREKKEDVCKIIPDSTGQGLWHTVKKDSSDEESVRYYDFRFGKSMEIVTINHNSGNCWSMNPSNTRFALVDDTNKEGCPILIFDIKAGKWESPISKPVDRATNTLFFPDDNHLIHNSCTSGLLSGGHKQVLHCTTLHAAQNNESQLPLKNDINGLRYHTNTGILIGYYMMGFVPMEMTIYDFGK